MLHIADLSMAAVKKCLQIMLNCNSRTELFVEHLSSLLLVNVAEILYICVRWRHQCFINLITLCLSNYSAVSLEGL